MSSQRLGSSIGAGVGLSAACLFAGPGGLALGAAQVGLRIAAAVEIDPGAAATFASNFEGPGTAVMTTHARTVPPEHLRDVAGHVDLVLAAPPAELSKAAYSHGRNSRHADGLSNADAFCAHLAALQPRWFIYVTVPALLYKQTASRAVLNRLSDGIARAGFQLHYRVLDAADFGVAQRRRRLVIIGAAAGVELPRFPEPTHVDADRRSLTTEDLPEHVTAREALSGLESSPEPDEVVAGRWGHLLPAIPPGANYQYFATERDGHPPVFRWRSRYWSFLLKIDPDCPSPTIYSQPGPYTGPFHWDSRRLRAAELTRLFGFPDDFHFVGTRAAIRAQIGGAVPPPLAAALVAEVRAAAGLPSEGSTSHGPAGSAAR